MRKMKGARALASGMLVLALSCAVPAISAAQDAGTTTTATTTTVTTTTTPDPPAPPADPGEGSAPEGGSHGNGKPTGQDGDGATPEQAEAPAPASSPPTATVSSPSKRARASASATVTMGDLFFSPSSVTVAVGDTVTWHNTGQAPHNATADDGSFKTQDLNNGQSASHTFTQAGTFSYICTIHPNMKGTVRVLASSGGGGGGGGGASSSSSGSAGSSEASAVTSPDAAGNSSTLPMTGMAVGGLALVGLGLIALGLIARQADRERFRLRWFSIF
jgi:plastocyanin